MPIGPLLPDWKIAFSWKDKKKMDLAADASIATLLWTGSLAVAGIIALGLLAAGLLRRQMAVAQLKNDLVANVTHELKTPLSSMRLLVDTLLNSPAIEEKTAREYLQLIARENLRLSHLIDNFLAFSRIERDKYAFDFHPVPARQIVDSAAAAVRERFNTPGCRFTVAAPAELPAIVADAGAMVTALLNLLDNAWKYSGEEKQIVLTASAANGTVHFAVQDNGIGLPEGETSRIFKRFYQVDPHLSRTGSGCGLGLSIVQFIVSAHHGGVEVESQPGRGSTFTITLPVAGGQDVAEGAK
jgi:signal transduction histidine kinase